jgi:hypothetical protein
MSSLKRLSMMIRRTWMTKKFGDAVYDNQMCFNEAAPERPPSAEASPLGLL